MSQWTAHKESIAIRQQLHATPGRIVGSVFKAAATPCQTGAINNKPINEEAAAAIESLAMNHPFVDDNKRVAFFTMGLFSEFSNRVEPL